MLTKQLCELEEAGVVQRKAYPEVPSSITGLCAADAEELLILRIPAKNDIPSKQKFLISNAIERLGLPSIRMPPILGSYHQGSWRLMLLV